MVYSAQSPLPPTITVLHEECRGRISLRQLAKDLNANRRNLMRAKNWLIENRHPSFEGYAADTLLNPEQAEAIIRYRSYTTAGVRGDALTEKMLPDVVTFHAKKDALRDLFEQNHIPPEQAAQLTHSILEIFNR
ncbi:MAG: hypothetical protein HLUCCA11_19795 [Phormidesmis priestleyi Ana]|uniref:Uncharacterized protein n=1 Tax=Phormidesmis priestleyi Ana TaxID=1666911 RepID=A0A0P8DA97_9CYAN|nr:MAG: hypothetical protein HLUCCA11_19795 [Phormidesmis priestleyi Ana]